MQQEKEDIYRRLEALKDQRRWSWTELAAALDLSVGMLMMVKSGSRNLSERAMTRLRQVEAEGPRPNPIPAKVPEEVFLSDHEVPAEQYDGRPTGEELLERIYRKDKATYEQCRVMLAALDQWLTKKRKRKR